MEEQTSSYKFEIRISKNTGYHSYLPIVTVRCPACKRRMRISHKFVNNLIYWQLNCRCGYRCSIMPTWEQRIHWSSCVHEPVNDDEIIMPSHRTSKPPTYA
jgi:hypothetical protein